MENLDGGEVQIFSAPMTSLIYAEKFEFENPAIMKDRQCKQTKRYSVIAKRSDCFLSLDG